MQWIAMPALTRHIAAAGLLWGSITGACAQTELTAEVGSWVPYINFSSPYQGVLTRQVRDAFKAAGVNLQLREASWKAAEEHIDRSGAVSFGWIKTSERLTRWRFSHPICSTRTVLVMRQSQPLAWTKLEQLKGIRLGWSRGYSYGEALDQLRPALQITEMGNDELALRRLLMGSVDAVPMDPLVARQLIATLFTEQEGKQLLIDLSPQHTIEKTELHVVCAQSSANCAATIEQFNRGLKQRSEGHTPACGD